MSSKASNGPIDFSLYGGAESFTSAPKSLDKASNATILQKTRRTVVESPINNSSPYPAAGTPPKNPSDFLWLMTEEPHRSRRMEIMKAHPEVTKLMGYESLTKYVVIFVVLLQVSLAFLFRHTSPFSPIFLLTAYVVGGTANHNLFLAIHEITHNLAFKTIFANRALAVVANLPIGIPYAAAFKGYHIDHHKHMGQDGIDTDLPTKFELMCLNNVLGKVFFATFQVFFYALRPPFVKSQRLTTWHISNIISQITFDILLIYLSGVPTSFWQNANIWALDPLSVPSLTSWSLSIPPFTPNFTPLLYLLLSSFFAGSLHPLAGHFIAEHYVWDGLEQETYSYYGILNIFAYNVGYHNEHHDFPSIPWTRLPLLKKLAPEFYDTIPSHPSWPGVIWNFIMDPIVGNEKVEGVGMWSRVKRVGKGVPKGCTGKKDRDGKMTGREKEQVDEGVSGTDVSGSEGESDKTE